MIKIKINLNQRVKRDPELSHILSKYENQNVWNIDNPITILKWKKLTGN